MNKFVLIVEFDVKPESLVKFNQAIAINAKASVAEEPGCRFANPRFPEKCGQRTGRFPLTQMFQSWTRICSSPASSNQPNTSGKVCLDW